MEFSMKVTPVAIWAIYGWRFLRWGPLMPSEEETGMSEHNAPTVDLGSPTETTEAHTTEKRPTRPITAEG